MNIVLVTDEIGIEVFKSWNQVRKYTSFKKEDFTPMGKDFILNTTNDSFEIAKDIKLLEHVAAKKMFTKNKMDFSDLIGIVTLFMVFVLVAS